RPRRRGRDGEHDQRERDAEGASHAETLHRGAARRLRYARAVRAIALSVAVFVVGCSGGRDVAWYVRFESESLASSATAVEASIYAGSACSGTPVYRVTVDRSGAIPMPASPLAGGAYAFCARGMDDT